MRVLCLIPILPSVATFIYVLGCNFLQKKENTVKVWITELLKKTPTIISELDLGQALNTYTSAPSSVFPQP